MDASRDLTLLAKVLPHLFARWRHEGDFEILADLPDGEIVIDALRGLAHQVAVGGNRLPDPIAVPLRIAREIQAGFADQLARKGIAPAGIRLAEVRVGVDTSKVKTDRARIVHFDFHIAARIDAEAGAFSAAQVDEHVWHARVDRLHPLG
jgi:hypothetical protein